MRRFFNIKLPVLTPLYFGIFIYWQASATLANEGTLDSIAYLEKRSDVLSKDSAGNWRYVTASDEIAALGLFNRARSSLERLTESKTDTAIPMQLKMTENLIKKRPSWRLNFGVDFVKFDDPEIARNETVIIDPRSLDDKRIFAGAEMTWEPRRLKAVPVTSSIEISNQDAVAGVRMQGMLADSFVSYSGRLEGRKRFWRDTYTADTTLRGDKILRIAEEKPVAGKFDSSDMIRGKINMKLTNKNQHARIVFSAPLECILEKYVENRPPYISYFESGFSPSVTYTSRDMATSLLLELDARYRNYEPVRSGAVEKDTLNRLSLRPELALNIRRKRISVEARCSYAYDQYPAGRQPEFWGELTSYGKTTIKITDRTEPGLIIQYRHERMRTSLTFADTLFYLKRGFLISHDTAWKSTAYTLSGNTFEISPQMRFHIFENLSIGIILRNEFTGFPFFSSHLYNRATIESVTSTEDSLLVRDYLDESQRLIAPEISIGLEGRRVKLSTRLGYEFTEAEYKDVYHFNTKQALRLGLNANADFAKRLSVFAIADMEFGVYNHERSPQTNTSLFGGLTIRLP